MIASKKHIIAFALASLLAAHPAFADKPEHAGGNGKNGRDQGQSSQQKQSHKNDHKESKKKNEGHKQNKKNDETRSASAKHDENSSRRNNTDHSSKQLSNRSDDDRRSGDDRRYNDDRRHNDVSINVNFNDRQRTYIHDYYREEFSRGHCPPGLAKKHNGCMPPGQAKKWRKGYRLDRDIVYYDLPPSVIIELGQPPRGYKYVRVAADILMIAIGTGLVVDAVADLSDM